MSDDHESETTTAQGDSNSIKEAVLSEADMANRKLGLVLFVVYAVIYAGFVFISAFAADQMERPIFGGLNLAVVYGMVLIVLAFVMAIIYGALCRSDSDTNA